MFVIVALLAFVLLSWLLDSAPAAPPAPPPSHRNAWEAHAAHMEDWFGRPHYTFTRPPPPASRR